jgi:hypothetical protein
MQSINLRKCFISATCNGTADISFDYSGVCLTKKDNGFTLEFDVDVTKTFILKMFIKNLSDNGNIKIDKILLNSVELQHFNNFTWFVTKDRKVRKDYGWIDQNGEFIIKIRQNPISQNYLNYILSLTKK